MVQSGKYVELSWQVSGAKDIQLSPGIGAVKAKGNRSVKLLKEQQFTLTAKSLFGFSSQATVCVQVIEKVKLNFETKLDFPKTEFTIKTPKKEINTQLNIPIPKLNFKK